MFCDKLATKSLHNKREVAKGKIEMPCTTLHLIVTVPFNKTSLHDLRNDTIVRGYLYLLSEEVDTGSMDTFIKFDRTFAFTLYNHV